MTPCERCGRLLREDALRFVVEIAITADVPASLDLGKSAEAVAEELEQLLASLEEVDAGEAEREVHERLAFVLCPACREAFTADPLGTGRSAGRVS